MLRQEEGRRRAEAGRGQRDTTTAPALRGREDPGPAGVGSAQEAGWETQEAQMLRRVCEKEAESLRLVFFICKMAMPMPHSKTAGKAHRDETRAAFNKYNSPNSVRGDQ